MKRIVFLGALLSAAFAQALLPNIEKAKQLKKFIESERPAFEKRETEKRGILTELDRLNNEQNSIRESILSINQSHRELSMAFENLSLEHEKQSELEHFEKHRFFKLLKLCYQFKRDGVLRFLLSGQSVDGVVRRFRLLYKTLHTQRKLSLMLTERAKRLLEGEAKIGRAKEELDKVIVKLKEEENLLSSILRRKENLLKSIHEKQRSFLLSQREYSKMFRELSHLFEGFESSRVDETQGLPTRGSLMLPIESGKIIKHFGKTVHQVFGTVIQQKGIEIEAEHRAPVMAVLPGKVEFEGWVKGMGNMLIIHHGGGFYSLSGHLFKAMKPKGASVEQGEVIGLVGDTGKNQRPSLYFEMREKSRAIDPLPYFSPSSLLALS